MPERKFKWPCARRDAHGPHRTSKPVMEPSVNGHLPVMRDIEEYDCPGVKAHPATMIGGGYKEGEY